MRSTAHSALGRKGCAMSPLKDMVIVSGNNVDPETTKIGGRVVPNCHNISLFLGACQKLISLLF